MFLVVLSQHWTSDGRHFFWSTERHGFWQLELYDRHGVKVRTLNDVSKSDVVNYRKLVHVDEKAEVVYVLGGQDATQQHLFRLACGSLSTRTASNYPATFTFPAPPHAMTTSVGVHNATFASGVPLYVHENHTLQNAARYFVRQLPRVKVGTNDNEATDSDENDSPASPTKARSSKRTSSQSNNGMVIDDVDGATGGKRVSEIVTKFEAPPFFPNTRIFTVDAVSELKEEKYKAGSLPSFSGSSSETVIRFNASLTLPSSISFDDIDLGTIPHKLPTILYVYGGPHHRLVSHERSGFLLPQWLANEGFAVVCLDNRGTPYRGREWERIIKNDFLTIPMHDQCIGLKAVAKRYEAIIDLERVGIEGWSYGGYMAAMGACTRPDVFKAGFSGAPVCSWEDYDTHYTERYISLPQDNPAGYRRSDVLSYSSQLIRPLLIAHGTADDNVYFSHALKMSNGLFRAQREHQFLPLLDFTHSKSQTRGCAADEHMEVYFVLMSFSRF